MKTADEWMRKDIGKLKPFIEAIQADARQSALTEAVEVNVEFVLPTGYTGINTVKGIHFNSGHAHGVADTRQAILTLRDKKGN